MKICREPETKFTDRVEDRVESMRDRERQPWLVLLLAATVLSIVVGTTAGFIEAKYFMVHPYFYDPAIYLVGNAEIYQDLVKKGPMAAAWFEIIRPDGIHPLSTLPLILLAPWLLASPLGCLGTAIPAFLCLLWLFGITAYKRTGSLVYAIAAMLMMSVVPGLYHPTCGLSTYWLDVVSGLLIGCAALSIINYDDQPSNRWLILFSIFVSAAILTRYVAVAYVLVACYPPLMLVFFRHFRRGIRRNFLAPLLTVTLPPLALTGAFLFHRLAFMRAYYGTYGYALNQPLPAVISDSLSFLTQYLLGMPLAIFLLAAISFNIICFACSRDKEKKSLFALVFPSLAFISFAIVVLRAGSSGYIFWNAVPLLLTAALIPSIPWTSSHTRLSPSVKNAIAWGLIVASAIYGTYSISNSYALARHAYPENRGLKVLDRFIGSQISSLKENQVWVAFFDEYGPMPMLENFYQTKQLRPMYPLFTVHLAYWKGWFPGLSLEQLCERIYKRTNNEISMVFAFDDPQAPYARSCYWLDNEWSKKVASVMSEKLKTDPAWRKVTVFDAVRYGKIAVYERLSPSTQKN